MVTDPQLSIFIMTNAKGSEGHAIACDSRAQHLHYFDPDAGYFCTDVMSAEVQLRWFIDILWESQHLFHYKQDYSTDFHVTRPRNVSEMSRRFLAANESGV